ncbi:hypothetical protein [Beggiatoa leptomitoformis]|uniref:Uncharacterized protein n=1 Tax=Beggiatoa leptomitoformis TaxID=288004 RepID=A0A2N9YCH6_9GAMM|nr:hypothetical protein [Beggiatoa leptomitoformis]ALG66540.1 hypothetical protein AL038_00795 [Beggiatoa leptomitoformis]AUI68163.1 hypothetical protein BLE401_05250 [Beggiatoa leptomitoformis]
MEQQPLIKLAQEKKAYLQKAWIVETDAARKFKLEKEIEIVNRQISELEGSSASADKDKPQTGSNIRIDGNQINGNNNMIQVIVHQWRWWGIGLIGIVLLLVLIAVISPDKSQTATGDCNTVISGGNNITISGSCTPNK